MDCWNIFSFPIQWPSSLSIIFLLLKSCIDSFLGCILAQTLAAWLVAVTWLVAGFANFLANSDSVCKLVNNNPIKIETVRPFTTAFEHHNKRINKFVCFLYASMTQGDINCSILPSGIGGNGEFERKFEEI